VNTFTLKIIACDRVFYDGQCEILIFPAFDGEMAIMANHIPMTTTIEVGEIFFRKAGEKNMSHAVVAEGVLKVENNVVNMLVYSAESPDEIDKDRAEAALERARQQLQQKQSIQEYNISTASLARAVTRLRGLKNNRFRD